VSPLKIKISRKIMSEKLNKYANYSFSLLIMYGSSYMFQNYIAILRISQKALGTLPEEAM
jgi:hypothetical protein